MKRTKYDCPIGCLDALGNRVKGKPIDNAYVRTREPTAEEMAPNFAARVRRYTGKYKIKNRWSVDR